MLRFVCEPEIQLVSVAEALSMGPDALRARRFRLVAL